MRKAMPSSQGFDPDRCARQHSVILVIEDETMLAMELEQVLTEAGYEVVVAADGPAALARAADPALRLRAVIADLCLPGGLSGHEVVRRLRASWPGLPVIVVTGYALSAPQADLRGLGGPTARLQKPVEMQRLLQRLHDAISSNSSVA
jgi:CheY-like chemotaxis protein